MNNIPHSIVKNVLNLDSARTTTYMTEHEKDMILEINLVRSNPKGYVPFVKKYIQKLEAKELPTTSTLQDSINTAHELIAELEATEPLSLLEPHEKLREAAKSHGDEGKTMGNLTHTGANGSQPWDRIPAADPELVNGGENIVKGVELIRDAVITLLVDAGIPNRGHRKNILKPKWQFVACYEVGTVGDMPHNWLQLFAAPMAAPTMNNSLFDEASNGLDLSSFGNTGNAVSTSTTIEQAADGTVTTTTVATNADGSTTTTIEVAKPDGSKSTSISTAFGPTPVPSDTTPTTIPSTSSSVPAAPTAPIAAAPTGDVSDADLDTARQEDYMTDREKDMIKEVNLVRSNPAGYIPVVEAYIQKLEQDKANGATGWIDEDISTAKELIEELTTTPRLSILKPYKAIYTAAKLHGDEGKTKGDLEHQGADGSWPWDRVLRQAPELSDGNENLVGGPSDVKTSVMLLLVDTGIPNRGHRKTTLNPSWTYCGFYEVGTVGDMPNYWVQKYGY